MEDTVINIFEKPGISIKKRIVVVCHRLGKTKKMIVKFANRKDAELVLKSKKKLKDIHLLWVCSSTDGNCRLLSRETDSNSENVNASEKTRGGKVYIYQSLGPCYRFLYGQVKERYNEGLFHDFWVTNKTVWIKEYKYSKTMDVVTHISDL